MSTYNPTSPAFIELMDKHEQMMEAMLASPLFKEFVIDHACHSNTWHYEHQTLRVDLLTDGTWRQHQEFEFPQRSALLLIEQIDDHGSAMLEIRDMRSFEDIFLADPEEARRVAERLYEKQEQYIKESTRLHFEYMRTSGFIQ